MSTTPPDPVNVWPGHTQQLVPSLVDAAGNVIFHAVQIYSLTGTGCASIDAAGLVTLVNPGGTGKITANNYGMTSNAVTLNCLAQQPLLVLQSLSAASYTGPSLAHDSIVSGFGADLAYTTQQAASQPLPLSLGGTSVAVKDSAGVTRAAPLIGISPSEMNYVMPAGTAAGSATVTVTSGDGTLTAGTANVVPVAPGLFSANFNGKGVAAALAVRAAPPDFAQIPVPVLQCPALGHCVSVPIDVSEAGQVALSLYGTGIRGVSSFNNATCTVGSVPATVAYAGAQGLYAGLDQVNVILSPSLAGRGEVDIRVTVDGIAANIVTVNVK
jgi:uncharacterized protein (TIGR03437 family)